MSSTTAKLSQQEMLSHFESYFKSEGKAYQKTKAILVRKAIEGEVIITNTSDGAETQNTAKKDDHVIKNQTAAGEEYIISKKKLQERYELLEHKDDKYSIYKPTGTITALELSDKMFEERNLGTEFWFMASWGEKMEE